jgi:hypothetical protein
MLYNKFTTSSRASKLPASTAHIHLVTPTQEPSALLELALLALRRGSSFFAEAAVLVLVFGILDYFMLKGRIELPWILGALAISLGLLGSSVAMDFTARRWIKAHP